MDHLERQAQRLDPFLVKAAPGDGATQIAAVGRGFGGREGLGAGGVEQRLPVRQAGAALGHVGGIPPFLLGLHAGGTEDHDISGGDGCIHRLAPGGFPDFHRDMQIARFKPGELRKVIGLDIFDGEARLLQHRTHELGGDELPGPVVQREADRVGCVLCRGRQAGGRDGGEGCSTEHGARPGPGLSAIGHLAP